MESNLYWGGNCNARFQFGLAKWLFIYLYLFVPLLELVAMPISNNTKLPKSKIQTNFVITINYILHHAALMYTEAMLKQYFYVQTVRWQMLKCKRWNKSMPFQNNYWYDYSAKFLWKKWPWNWSLWKMEKIKNYRNLLAKFGYWKIR